MSNLLRLREVRIYKLAIPMRVRFEHFAAERAVTDPVVVVLGATAPFAHLAGCGETLARPYVSGETPDSVLADIEQSYVPMLSEFQATNFAEALERIETLPTILAGRVVTAARAAVELALLDLACQAYSRRSADIAGWMGLPGFGAPGCVRAARYSGVVIGKSKAKLQWLLRLQRLAGLRDFKLKVAIAGWEERLDWACQVLGPALARKTATLRVDANAGWSLAEVADALPLLEDRGVCALEQPLPDTHDADLGYLAEQSSCDIIADESLLTLDDGQRLIAGGGVKIFNIRIAKNGGLMPALRLARLALTHGLDVQLGCLVGETSILTAAGLAFLEACPRVRFVEGAFGTWLLRRDVTTRTIRFGLGGRIRPRPGYGLGVTVDAAALDALASRRVRVALG